MDSVCRWSVRKRKLLQYYSSIHFLAITQNHASSNSQPTIIQAGIIKHDASKLVIARVGPWYAGPDTPRRRAHFSIPD
jgi:hypothetical protein